MNIVKVGMADLNVAVEPDVLRTVGLGSCVGVAIVDLTVKVGGLAHVMLPNAAAQTVENPAKYADTAIPLLVKKMQEKGAVVSRMVAKIAGGAQMFSTLTQSDLIRIGPRNVEAVKEALTLLRIPLRSEDTGGNSGRTIDFSPVDGMLTIRTVSQGVKTI
ncbi:chemotaxis protein CheD [Effusibacillus dendaii]|uniref:Probable chemoreceptor glutamine deamidase CheD n=1 Tax=Effusibacillus dendaii TaxID=2743772 RepID=A0A7I8D5C9_9BACL|nr:chemotaxis protein CheD [Effusibacillus dendaii]BCJ85285.1 chemoreceptor glutamine deamidase CheD [Effusibacillus dendaii]